MKEQINSTIKVHPIRGAFYVLLLLAVCVIPFALAQRYTTSQSWTKPDLARPVAVAPQTVVRVPPMPKFPTVVLYDQLDNPGTFLTSSQEFPDIPEFTSFAADDFVVPGGQAWTVTEVDAGAGYLNGPGPVDNFNVFFYQDSGGLPGTQIYTAIAQSYVDNAGVFQVTLSVPALLTSGTYWVSVQAHMSFTPNGQWSWTDRTVQANSPAAWQNPGGGFGVGCLTWCVRTTIGDPGAPDQMFRVVGTAGGGTPTPTPTATATATPTATATATPIRPTPTPRPRPTPPPRP